MTSDGDAANARERGEIGGALDALLQVEQRIQREVAAARAEAEQRLEEARAEARRLAADDDGTGREAVDALRASIEAEADAEITRLERDAADELERYQRVDEELLDRLARHVVASILSEEEPPS